MDHPDRCAFLLDLDLFKEQEIADYRQAFKPSIFNIALAHEWYGVQGKQIGEFRRIKRY